MLITLLKFPLISFTPHFPICGFSGLFNYHILNREGNHFRFYFFIGPCRTWADPTRFVKQLSTQVKVTKNTNVTPLKIEFRFYMTCEQVYIWDCIKFSNNQIQCRFSDIFSFQDNRRDIIRQDMHLATRRSHEL